MTPQEAKKIFNNEVEEVDEKEGQFLTVTKTKDGRYWTVYKWSSVGRNFPDILERKILLMHGKIFENKIKIGTY